MYNISRLKPATGHKTGFTWKKAFSKINTFYPFDSGKTILPLQIRSLETLKDFLDWVHIKYCLLKPYFEYEDYPLVEGRELLPSFEFDVFEYLELPGFSMVAFCRPLNYFKEVFQFDLLHEVLTQVAEAAGQACPLEQTVFAQNLRTFLRHLPRRTHDEFRRKFFRKDLTELEDYSRLFSFLLQMDRAHVLALNNAGNFHLAGVDASFPSHLDTEIKRFGLRIGKFTVGDNPRYERNRIFVYKFLMELYGFPIVSERRTSSAMFSRRLFAMGEKFLVRVLGKSDRTLTTIYSHPESKFYPRVEKIALVRVGKGQKEARRILGRNGYFVDREKGVVILRVVYKQHKFDSQNVRQDRALSVLRQEVIHPLTGVVNDSVNIISDTTNMFLYLNDIVRGEYAGRIIYKRNEVVENTETHEKRLKFLYAWLSKHQRRIIGYSDDFYAKVVKVLDSYLLNPENHEIFRDLYKLHRQVWFKYSYIQQARKVKILEDLQHRVYRQAKINYLEMLERVTALLNDLKFEIVSYFDRLTKNIINIGENILHDPYLVRRYVDLKDKELTPYGIKVKKQYGFLVSLVDEFKAIRKSRLEQPEA